MIGNDEVEGTSLHEIECSSRAPAGCDPIPIALKQPTYDSARVLIGINQQNTSRGKLCGHSVVAPSFGGPSRMHHRSSLYRGIAFGLCSEPQEDSLQPGSQDKLRL